MTRPLAFAALLLGFVAASPVDAQTVRDLTAAQIVGNVPYRDQVEAADKLGIKVVRLAIRWNEVEKAKGRFDWQGTDARFKVIEQLGMTPIITLFGGNNLYRTAEEKELRTSPSSESSVAGFAAFSAAAAERFGTEMNGRPILYEIWNEPNTKTFWNTPPNPEAYATLATASCKAIKGVSADNRVVGLAMEGTPVKKPYFVRDYGIDIYQEWADRAATLDLMACVDGISMHPYREVPESYLSDEPALQAFLAKHWSRETPPVVANTEWGYNIDLRKRMDAESQASRLLRSLLIGVGLKRSTNLYQSLDTGTDENDPRLTYGLFDRGGGIKPSGTAIKNFLSAVGDFEVVGVRAIDGVKDGYRLDLKKGERTATVVWSSWTPVSIDPGRLQLGAATQGTALLTGQPLTPTEGTMEISTSPVLFVTP